MKSSIYKIFFLFIFHLSVSAQIINTAIICNPRLGSDNGEKFFSSVIDNVNVRTDIDLVVIIGNLTYSGSYDQLSTFESILNKLTIPFRIVSGPNDILLNETNGEEIMQKWPEGQNIVHSPHSDKYFIQTIPLINSTNEHISIETLNSLSKGKPQNQNIFLFTYNSFENYTDNFFRLTNLLEGYKLFSFSVFQGNKGKIKRSSSNFIFNSLTHSKEWDYNILKESSDTISIYRISEKKMQPELIESITISELVANKKIDSLQTLSFLPGTIINRIADENFTTYSPILFSENRIFSSNKKGTIFCYNDQGEKLWHYSTNGKLFNSISKDRDLIITVTMEGDIHTINSNNGDLFQAIGIGDIISSDFDLIDIVQNDLQTKGIIFGTASGDIYCYELYSLEMIWENHISDFNITSKLLIINDKIIFRDVRENYYCVNASNGVLIWEWNAEVNSPNQLFRSDIIGSDNSIYIVDSDGNIHSIDILLGTNNWSKKISSSGKIFFSKSRSSLFAHLSKNKILELDRSRGKVLSEVKLAEEFENILPSAWLESKTGLLVGFDNGVIIRIDKNLYFNKILFSGNAPVISIVETGDKIFVTNNLDDKITKFVLP